MKIGAVLLAAGEGSRMGGLPKCLLTLDGVPLIRRHLQAMRDAGVDRVVVVTGHYHQHIEPAIASFEVSVERNPNPDDGQPSSVRVGMQALGGEFDVVVIALADQPLIGVAELVELTTAFTQRSSGKQILYPQVKGQRGNPVLFAGELIGQMLASGKQVAGRKFIDEHPELVHIHESDNHRFILDLDTREDITTFEKQTGFTIELPASSASR